MRVLKILLIFTLVGLVGCEGREEARRKQITKNLKQIGLALHAYHAQNPKPANDRESAPSDETPITVVPNPEDKTAEVVEPRPGVPE